MIIEKGLIVGIAATDWMWGIGRDGNIPWYSKDDFKWFRSVTDGCDVYMGRATWDSLGGVALPNRDNYVLTSSESLCGAFKANDTIECTRGDIKFVIGGSGAFNTYRNQIDCYLLTSISGDFGCDTIFDRSLLRGFSPLGGLNTKSLGIDLVVDVYSRLGVADNSEINKLVQKGLIGMINKTKLV